MKHLKRFFESIEVDRMDLLKDIFDDLDLYFDVSVDYYYSGMDNIWSDRIPGLPRELVGVVRFISVSIHLSERLSKEILEKIVELSNMSIGYCDVKFERWHIISVRGSILKSSKELDKYNNRMVSNSLESIRDFYQDKNPIHPIHKDVGEIRIEFKEDISDKLNRSHTS